MSSKFQIIVDNNKCVGCLACALHCSFSRQGLFNPFNAYIRISTPIDRANDISFTDDCDNCGICARYCPYGALVLEKESREAVNA